MADDEEDDGPSDAQVLGVRPELAASAAFAGLPIVLSPVTSQIPNTLFDLVESGVPIKERFQTPISELAAFTKDEVKKIQGFAAERGVTVPILAGDKTVGSSYFYEGENPIKKLLGSLFRKAPTDPIPPHIGLRSTSIPGALHEIGHASPVLGSNALRKVLGTSASHLGAGSTVGTILRAALASNALRRIDEDSSKTDRLLHDYAPHMVGATFAPQLLEEGRATVSALRGSRKYGPGVMRTLAELTPAYATYLGAAAAPVLATILAKKLVKVMRDAADEQREKTAAATPGSEVKAPGALRVGASSAWRIGGQTPPKPKSIKPNQIQGQQAKTRATAKPPSNQKYYKDLLESLYNPQRGYRLATPG